MLELAFLLTVNPSTGDERKVEVWVIMLVVVGALAVLLSVSKYLPLLFKKKGKQGNQADVLKKSDGGGEVEDGK